MKIFFITPKINFENIGGSLIEYDLMIRTLMRLGHQVTVITAFSDLNAKTENLPYRVIEENIDRPRRLLKIQKRVFGILKKYSSQADFFHIDGQVFLYGAGLYRRLGGQVPVSAYFNRELVCWPDGEANFLFQNSNIFVKIKKALRFYIEKYIGTSVANGIDLMLFTNSYLRKSYENFGLRPRTNGALIFGDPVDHSKNKKEYRNKKNGPLNVFYSSRMVPGKGFELLITAFSRIKNKGNFKLILSGSGPEEQSIRKMISGLGIGPYVEIVGGWSRENFFQLLGSADIFIQPRWRTDLTSMSLINAMGFGVPSIVPKGGGLEWDVQGGALCFADGDANDLAQKIEQLGNDYELRARLSRACYARLAEDEMNHEKQISRWSDKMKEIKSHL